METQKIFEKFKHLFENLKDCPQDKKHHGEGNVYIHTQMVYNEMNLIIEKNINLFSDYEKKLLLYCSMFHDIAKPQTLTIENGKITNPKHAKIGANLTRLSLDNEGYNKKFVRDLYFLILYHGYPFWVFNRDTMVKDIINLSLHSSNKLLYYFAKADLYGRICEDKEIIEENLEYYREICLEYDVFDKPFKFNSELDRINFLNSDNIYPYSNISKEFENNYLFDIYLMVGLPGVGKNTYINKNLSNLPIMELDKLRYERKAKYEDKKAQGQIIQDMQEMTKEKCRKKQSFVYNATNITKDLRKKNINMWMVYKPKITIIHIDKNIDKIIQNNKNRPSEEFVPIEAILRMNDKFDYPTFDECHNIITIY